MSLDAGRARLFTSWKTLQERWHWIERYWHDGVRREFIHDHWEPLEPCVFRMLAAVDQLSQVFNQARQECS